MKKNDQKIYEQFAKSAWEGSFKFQRLLANQVNSRLEYFNQIVNNWQNLDVLDLGCGGGFMSEALCRLRANVVGVDPCLPLLETAKEHTKLMGLDIIYREGKGEAIPAADNSFDCVVCVDVLEHVEDVKIVLHEIRRVLKEGGLFMFDTMNRNWFSNFMAVRIMEDILRIIPIGTHDPEKFIKPEELKQYLELTGFTCSDKFKGMGIIRLNKHFEPEIGLTNSTKVMYIGYARKS